MLKRDLYHCTYAYHGDTLLVRRACPRLRAAGEPCTPRLCASPTVLQCFAARLFESKPIHVYCIFARGVTPAEVWDSFITEERWLLPGQMLSLIDTVTVDVQHLTREYHRRTKRNATWRIRLATMLEAADAIEPQFPQGCKRWRRIAADMGVTKEILKIEIDSLSQENIDMCREIR